LTTSLFAAIVLLVATCLRRGAAKGEIMAEVKLLVLYPTPTDPEAFDRAYAEEHAPMVNEKIANMTRWTAAKVVASPTEEQPPFHMVAELYFPSVEALQEALGTEGGQQTAAHAVSISSGGPPVLLIAQENSYS
jgi:uncharacterized protein (TIGR02118 family)